MYFIFSLFFGGYWPIRVASIRVVETKQNFKPIIKALSIFDQAMNGGQLRDGNSKKKAMDKSTERLLFSK